MTRFKQLSIETKKLTIKEIEIASAFQSFYKKKSSKKLYNYITNYDFNGLSSVLRK